jgi:anaerobic magnesium-protoporphyrin IX monomethyl ester cyclase
MKVLFVYSLEDVQSISSPLRSWASIQFGISYISAVLKSHSHQTQLMIMGSGIRWGKNVRLIRRQIEHFAPRVICFTAVASQFSFIKRAARFIKSQWPDIFLVIGGINATLFPEEAIADTFDALCIGEGESPSLELCNQLETGNYPLEIPNLWIKSADGTVEKNAPRPYNQQLDELPFPDRTMWAPWMKEQLGTDISIMLGRGCPNDCTYCCHHALRKVTQGYYIRLRSAENIIQEIALLHRDYPSHHHIFFELESIAMDKAWMLDLCDKLEEFNSGINSSLSFACNFRISKKSIDEDIFKALKRAQFDKINIGLESGSERIRREVLNRDYSNRNVLDAVAMARKYGLRPWVFNMIGLPGESWEDYVETVSLNRQCQPDGHYTSIFVPYPGTEIHSTCRRNGYLAGSDISIMERRQATADFPEFSRRKIQKAYTWFTYRVYKGHRSYWWALLQTFVIYIKSHKNMNLLFRKIVQWKALSRLRARLAW